MGSSSWCAKHKPAGLDLLLPDVDLEYIKMLKEGSYLTKLRPLGDQRASKVEPPGWSVASRNSIKGSNRIHFQEGMCSRRAHMKSVCHL